jgi:hypothetical protein
MSPFTPPLVFRRVKFSPAAQLAKFLHVCSQASADLPDSGKEATKSLPIARLWSTDNKLQFVTRRIRSVPQGREVARDLKRYVSPLRVVQWTLRNEVSFTLEDGLSPVVPAV